MTMDFVLSASKKVVSPATSSSSKSMLIDLDLNARKKIVIETVRGKDATAKLKERAAKRRNPLAGFSSADSLKKVASIPATQSSPKEHDPMCKRDTAAETTTKSQLLDILTATKTTEADFPLAFPTRSKARVKEGRIEKSNRAPEAMPVPSMCVSSADSVQPRVPPYYNTYKDCPCTRGGRPECPRCRLLRLADRFCTIVDVQCEKMGIEPPSRGIEQ
ncbi:hypothetical protein BDQ17DRAFT_1405931 [Cyathus striatus]|nr:hypothetical protein BDQ17DRAFT_1405931 [Cyathus striatus]